MRRSNDVSISGLGLASILTQASEVTDSMVEASSLGLAHALTEEEHSLGLLYPRIERSKVSLLFLISHLTLTSFQFAKSAPSLRRKLSAQLKKRYAYLLDYRIFPNLLCFSRVSIVLLTFAPKMTESLLPLSIGRCGSLDFGELIIYLGPLYFLIPY